MPPFFCCIFLCFILAHNPTSAAQLAIYRRRPWTAEVFILQGAYGLQGLKVFKSLLFPNNYPTNDLLSFCLTKNKTPVTTRDTGVHLVEMRGFEPLTSYMRIIKSLYSGCNSIVLKNSVCVDI